MATRKTNCKLIKRSPFPKIKHAMNKETYFIFGFMKICDNLAVFSKNNLINYSSSILCHLIFTFKNVKSK